jgi:predicted methyltransferase
MPPRQSGPAVLSLVFLALGCGASRPVVTDSGDSSQRARATVDAPDRTDADRQVDPGRRPAELLTFLGVTPGMRVGEIIAGAGYTTELLARAVAPTGVVYAENPLLVLRDAEGPWSKRLATPAMKTVVRVDRELEDPFPPQAGSLDLVLVNLVYHDIVAAGIDRGKMNRAVFLALRSGGTYAVVDHSARHGGGLAYVKTLHRIDEATLRTEVEGAGFRLQTADSFLRNPADTRDWDDAPGPAAGRRGTSDRFALIFVKP